MRVGSVQRAHATQGEIFVDPEYFGSVTGDAVMSAASKEAALTAIGASSVIKQNRFWRLSRDAVSDAFTPPTAEHFPTITITNGSSTTISGGVLTREKRVADVSTGNLDILGDNQRFQRRAWIAPWWSMHRAGRRPCRRIGRCRLVQPGR